MPMLDDLQAEQYIREAAMKRGIDPNIALKVWGSEGKTGWMSNARKNGIREPSGGDFQLLLGGPGTGYPVGMGNDFLKDTGLHPHDRNNRTQTIDYALDKAREGGWGPWYGAKKVGITGKMGIGELPIEPGVNEPTPERTRWDALMNSVVPQANAADAPPDPNQRLGNAPAAPANMSPMPPANMSPVPPGFYPSPQPDRLAPAEQAGEPPMDVTPSADNPAVSPAETAGIDPEVAKYFDSLKPKQNKWGPLAAAGMAIGGGLMESAGHRGMAAAGIAAGNSLSEGQMMKLKEQEIEAANMPTMMRYQRNIEAGMSSRDAFLSAVSSKDRDVSAGYEWGPDGSQRPVKGGPYDPETIATQSKIRAKAQTDAIGESPEVQSVVEGIQNGDLPPTTTGMYRYGVAVKAELAKRKFNFARAALEYKTAERQISGLNAPRMQMFVGLARSVLGTMDEVKTLSQEMDNSGLTGYNRAKLELLVHTQGNTPQGQLATKYIAAVNTLKEEFANLANGGYAPTESAWKLAEEQVNGNFGVKQMGASIDELKRLINYRLTAIPGLLDRGPGGANRYTGQEKVDITKHGGIESHDLGDHSTPPPGLTPDDAEAWQLANPEERKQIEELYGIDGMEFGQ